MPIGVDDLHVHRVHDRRRDPLGQRLVDGRTITCTNLTLDATSSASAHVEVTCALTYSTGNIAGNVHTTGDAVVSGTTYTWNATLKANQITFSETALTGGSLDVSATVTTSTSADEDEKCYSAAATVSLP